MKKENNEFKWKYITVIICLLILVFGIYLFYPYHHSAELECTTGNINLDYKTYWVHEKVKVEIPQQPIPCKWNENMSKNECEEPVSTYIDSWNSKALPQYLRIMGIDNMNCKLKVSGTYNNMQVLGLLYDFKDYLKNLN